MPEVELLALLGEDVRSRASEIENAGRAADLLWTRLLLMCLAKNESITFQENAPFSPIVIGNDAFQTTISHTATYVGAALALGAVAIDIEVMQTRRPLKAIARKVFGEAFWSDLPTERSTECFYEAWGVHECAVKLGLALSVKAGSVRISHEKSGKGGSYEILIRHKRLQDNTLLTLAYASELTPRIELWSVERIRSCLTGPSRTGPSRQGASSNAA